MSKEFSRSERISESIQKSLSQLIGENIRDPRVGMVSINHVAVTKDYSIARVYVSFVDARGEENAKLGVEALNGASTYLRKLLSMELALRSTPKLRFFFDNVGDQANKISDLIDRAIKSDNKRFESTHGKK